jgi:hypothetical protein
MRIPERAKPPEGGAGLRNRPGSSKRRRFNAGAEVMRKAPAPGAEVAEVVGQPTHPPTGPVPDRGRCRKDARECACCCTQLTAVLLGPHCRAPPPSGSDSRLPRALMPRGNLGRTGRAVKSPRARTDGGHGRTPVPHKGAWREAAQWPARCRAGDGQARRATGLQEHQAARGDCVEDPPRERRRAWNGPTPKGVIFTSIIRPTECAPGRRASRRDGRTNRTGLQTSAGATRGANGGEGPAARTECGAGHHQGPCRVCRCGVRTVHAERSRRLQ